MGGKTLWECFGSVEGRMERWRGRGKVNVTGRVESSRFGEAGRPEEEGERDDCRSMEDFDGIASATSL